MCESERERERARDAGGTRYKVIYHSFCEPDRTAVRASVRAAEAPDLISFFVQLVRVCVCVFMGERDRCPGVHALNNHYASSM